MSDFESYGSDEEDYGLLKKALNVEMPVDFDPNKIPETGEEYLQHVIYERTKYKPLVTANIDRSQFENNQTFKLEPDNNIPPTPENFLPTNDWQTSKIDEFATFRKFIQSKLNKEPTLATFDEADFMGKITRERPQFPEMLLYAQAAKIRMLQIISKHLDTIENGNSFSGYVGTWLYAIFTLLEKPLSPSSCHTLREFAKRCLKIRSKLPKDANEDQFVPLNLFICIVARFYNQLDLADPFI